MKETIKTFNISGMGCSAGGLAVEMARDLLGVYRNSYAVLVGTENITVTIYEGSNKSMMLTNCLFRDGGNALLLSNKPTDASRAKMKLVHSVRTNTAAHDDAYGSVMVEEDADGIPGISLSYSLIEVAGKGVTKNMVVLGPKVLPITELL
eukprot:Gb_15648 [translate_table: standard]